MTNEISQLDINSIERDFPEIITYLSDCGIKINSQKEKTLSDHISLLSDEFLQEIGLNRELLMDNLVFLFEQPQKNAKAEQVESITILGGKNKSGQAENVELTLSKGSITGIVGPTGSGKSRLLADVEWMANRDTPTGRRIRINGKEPDMKYRFSLEHKLVAQLSQNMNFVMDATVREFIEMHAESRFVKNAGIIEEVIRQANELAGESFLPDTPLTSLSGGQSRALMIADTAFLSKSPIVLIDEIENAGIDRNRALSLLVKKEKIILLATHDPILALLCNRRIVIRNGGIAKIIEMSSNEKNMLIELERLDRKIHDLRNKLRQGDEIDLIIE